MEKIAIIGSGDLGQLIAHHAKAQYIVAGFFDDFASVNVRINNIPVLGKINYILHAFESGLFDKIIIGIGYKHFAFRKELYKRFKDQIPFAKIVHSSSYVDPSCKIGDGVVILPGCILDRNVVVCDNVLINTGSTLAHDTKIGAHTFLSPRVAIAGFVNIGECCNIGINTTIIDNIEIIDNVQTGGGTVVIKNIFTSGLYVGIPATFIR